VDVAIIGGGPAGLAAALACRKQGIENVVIMERDEHLGGILQQCIHNGFGLHRFGEELTGPEYAQRFIDEVEKQGIACYLNTMVIEITPDKRIYAVNPEEGVMEVQAKAIILAMGCRERTRGAIKIPGDRPAGVYTAGMAQRLINLEGYMPGKEVVILGSGDIGMIMARRMIWEGAKVKMVCEIMPYTTGLARNVRQCLEDNNIPLLFNHTIIKIHGKERVQGVTIAQVDENRIPIPGTEEFVSCDTVLLSVGLIPENELSEAAGVELDFLTSGAVVDEYRQTNIPGIFACGNVLHVHDLVDYVSEEGEIAGIGAARYIRGELFNSCSLININPGKGIRYVVPRKVRGNDPFELFFRGDNIYEDCRVELTDGFHTFLTKRFTRIAPGEMERIKINLSGIAEKEKGKELYLICRTKDQKEE